MRLWIILDLRALRVLVTLADNATLTRTAQVLGVSQPALTKTLAQLERRLGAALFDRSGRRLVLTDLGHQVLARARILLRDADELEAEVTGWRSGVGGQVRLGVGPMVEAMLLPEALASFYRTGRSARIAVRSGSAPDLLAGLQAGELDMVVADFEGAAGDDSLISTLLQPEPLALAVRPGHPVLDHDGDVRDFPGATATPPARMAGLTLDGGPRLLSLVCDDYAVLARVCAVSDHVLVGPERVLAALAASGTLTLLAPLESAAEARAAVIMRRNAAPNPARDVLSDIFLRVSQAPA